MAKKFFRHLRGELNGYYITKLHNTFNESTKDINDFLSDFKSQEFKNGKISNKDLYGLGKFAGIFLPRLDKTESINSLQMTNSHIVNDFEFSERGLFDKELESFRFFHTEDDTVAFFNFVRTTQEAYQNDINTLATNLDRSTLVGDEEVLGYIAEDEIDLFDEIGSVKDEKISIALPTGKASSDFYGNEFLMLSEGDDRESDRIVRARMTDSHIVDTVEYSERGLFAVPVDTFEDINNLATSELRSSLVGDEEIIGYISSTETDLFDENGLVKSEKILSTPPSDVAYSDFYGDKFLFLSEATKTYEDLSPELYIELFKALQWIRYNGVSLSALCRIVEIICPSGLVKIDRVEVGVDNKHFIVYYRYDDSVSVNLKQQRIWLLDYICRIKFIQVSLVEVQS